MRPQWPYRVNWRSPQANGLTAWWPFLAQGGRRAGAGTTPNQLNLIDAENWLQPSATASEQPQVSADPLGHSVLLFDKTDGRNMSSQVGWSSLLSASAGIISLWVYLTENGAAGTNTYDLGRLVTNAGTGTVGIHYGDRAGAGQKIHAYNWDGSDDFVAATVPQNEWHHLAWRHGGGLLYLYVDGISAGSTASGDNSPGNIVFVGHATSSLSVSGRAFDLRIYNKDIGPSAIYQMWHPATRWDLYAPYRLPWVAQFEAPPPPPNAPVFRLRRTA